MKTITLSLLLTSSVLHASCGDLNIQIINNSTQNCSLKNKVIRYGSLPEETVPLNIVSGQASPTFTATQDAFGEGIGVGVLLTYTCGNDLVKFYSWQSFCSFLTTPVIGGVIYNASTANLRFNIEPGDYWSDLPGKITWHIS